MNHELQPLIEYILNHRRQGFSDEQIRHSTLRAGWPEQYIVLAFEQAGPSGITDQTRPPADANHSYENHSQPEISPSTLPETNDVTGSVPQKYGIARAVIDALKAMRRNWVAFLSVTFLSYLLLIVVVLVSAPITYALLNALGGLGLIAVILLYSAIGSFSAALVLAAQAQTLYDGNNGHKQPINSTLKRAIKNLPRLALACLLVGLVIYGPLVVLPILAITFVLLGNTGSISILFPLLGLAAIIWLIIGLIRYSLAPLVVFFEPQTPIKKSLARSFHLLQGGGQWFVVKGVLLLMIAVIAISASAGIQTSRELQASDNPVVNGLLIVLSIMANAAMVMLYDNRRRVKDGADPTSLT